MSMRKLLRSISPFSKRNVTVEDPGPNVPVGQSTTKPTWSLQGADLHKVLFTFYSKYNPDKIPAIEEILTQYIGEEMVMLYELAEVYKLSQSMMQKIIDDSKKTDIDASVSSSSIEPPAPVEYRSVVTPQWENSKVTPDRLSHRSLPSTSSKHKKSGELNSYRPKSDIASIPKRVPPPQTTITKDSEPDRERDRFEMEDMPRVTPMTLQDIINTSRKNDSLMKKSVRFSPNLELATNVTTLPPSSYHTLSANRKLHQTDENVDRNASSRGTDEEGSTRDSLPRPVLNVTPVAELRLPDDVSSTDTHQDAPLPRHSSRTMNSTHGLSSVRTDQTSNQEQEDELREDKQKTNHHHYHHHHERENTPKSRSVDAPMIITHESATAPAAGMVRTESVGLEEMRRELERTRQALSQADSERHEVLNLLQEVVADPYEMQEVVERYLNNYGKRRNGAGIRGSFDSEASSESNHLGSDHVDGWRLTDLEGKPSSRVDYASSYSLASRAQEVDQRPYMLGTVASAKRKMELANAGKQSGNYPVLSSPLGNTQLRGRSMSRDRGGGRWVRPSPSAAYRSSSPSGSVDRRSARSPSPTPSVNSEIDNQPRRSQVQAQRRIEPQPSQGRPSSPQISTLGPDDWVACVDPKSKRTYYYSSFRKKSTWTLPESVQLGKNSWTPPVSLSTSKSAVPTGSRSNTPTTTSRTSSPAPSARRNSRERGVTFASATNQELQPQLQSRGRGRSPSPMQRSHPQVVRAASPSGSVSSQHSQGSIGNNSSDGGGSGGSGVGQWAKAVDPKSGRDYWFNRKTRESTWRRPPGAPA